jgi:SAM-dependent methyltransferase
MPTCSMPCWSCLQTRWSRADLDFALALAEVLLEQFLDPDRRRLLVHRGRPRDPDPPHQAARRRGHPVRQRDRRPGAPALGHLVGEPRYLDAAEATLKLAAESIRRMPYAHATLLFALDEWLDPPETLVIRAGDERVDAWRREAQRGYRPRRFVLGIPSEESHLPGTLAAMVPGERPRIYRCRGTHCEPPTDHSRCRILGWLTIGTSADGWCLARMTTRGAKARHRQRRQAPNPQLASSKQELGEPHPPAGHPRCRSPAVSTASRLSRLALQPLSVVGRHPRLRSLVDRCGHRNGLYLNLGYWTGEQTLDEACQALAALVAERSAMGPATGCWTSASVSPTRTSIGFGPTARSHPGPEHHRLPGGRRTRAGQRTSVSKTASTCAKARPRTMPLPSNSVDKVVALECAFHFKTRERFFAEAFRVLRPGGRLVTADIIPMPLSETGVPA